MDTLMSNPGMTALGVVGIAAIIYGAARIVVETIRDRRERVGHDDADYHCKYWWGDRQESIGAWCRACNPERQDLLIPGHLRRPGPQDTVN